MSYGGCRDRRDGADQILQQTIPEAKKLTTYLHKCHKMTNKI